MSEENFDRIQLLMSIPFEEMTPEDKALVLKEFGSQEAFESMVELMGPDELSEEPAPELEVNVLREYDAFHAKSKKAAFPWMRVAAAIAFLVVGGWFLVYVLDNSQDEKAIAELNESAADETEETSKAEDSQEKDSLPQLAELKEKEQQTIQQEIESPQIQEVVEDEAEVEMDMSEPKELNTANFDIAESVDDAANSKSLADQAFADEDLAEVDQETDYQAEPASAHVLAPERAETEAASSVEGIVVSERAANARATTAQAKTINDVNLMSAEGLDEKSVRQQSIDLTVKLPKNHYRAY